MSILDLQGLTAPEPKGPPPRSRASQACSVGSNDSTLSVLCDLLGG